MEVALFFIFNLFFLFLFFFFFVSLHDMWDLYIRDCDAWAKKSVLTHTCGRTFTLVVLDAILWGGR